MLDALFASVSDAFTLLLKSKAPLAYRREGRRLGYVCFLHTFGTSFLPNRWVIASSWKAMF